MMSYYKNSLTTAGNTIKPIALTEYNITSQGAKQQVSFVNGMHAMVVMAEAIKNNYGFTCRWDLSMDITAAMITGCLIREMNPVL